jgi:DNA-binding NarL/FixJ family response regulator
MDSDSLVRDAREAFARRDWVAARDAFVAVGALAGDDVYKLGDCVWWLGEFRRAESLYEEAHRLYMQERKPSEAAMCALGLAGLAFMRGDEAIGSGWMSRAMRLMEDLPAGAVHGYVLFMEVSGSLQGGDLDAAIGQARRLQEAGRTFSDPNLVALGVLSEGQALLKQGSFSAGMRLLDEAMIAAVSDELAPEWAGNIYCQLMVACNELGDVGRAREWTQATVRWCESLPAAGPFMGICRAHRAQLFRLQGDWELAEREAAQVCEELAGFDLGTVAEGYYQIGEVRRLRGDLAGAEEAFKQAHAYGREPQPGLALLRLAQGRIDEALVSIQTALTTGPQDPLHRAWLCIACAEASLAAGRVDAARMAGDELRAAATTFQSSVFKAAADQVDGAVLVTEGALEEGLQSLRSACVRWQQLSAPYETARVRVLLARAYAALGDGSSAALELDAASQVFQSLGAMVDLHSIEMQRDERQGADPGAHPGAHTAGHQGAAHGLTGRELEVLALVSAGQSNRGIAEALTISEKTVARHLTNIYGKLGLSSRTEAVRYAFEQGLSGDIRKTS